MNEVKKPKKSLIYYYGIVLLLLMLFNLFVMPAISQKAIHEVDYGTFMTMTESGEVGSVQIRSNQIKETGTHEQLIQLNGLYAELYNSQFAVA